IFRVIVKGILEAGTGTTRWITDDRSIFLPALGVGTFDLYGYFMTLRFAGFIFQDNKLLTVFWESLVAVVNIKSTVTFSIFVFFNGIFSWSQIFKFRCRFISFYPITIRAIFIILK